MNWSGHCLLVLSNWFLLVSCLAYVPNVCLSICGDVFRGANHVGRGCHFEQEAGIQRRRALFRLPLLLIDYHDRLSRKVWLLLYSLAWPSLLCVADLASNACHAYLDYLTHSSEHPFPCLFSPSFSTVGKHMDAFLALALCFVDGASSNCIGTCVLEREREANV